MDVDTDPTAPILAPGILHNQVRLDASAGCSGVTTGGMIHSLAPAGVLGPTTPAVFAAAGHAGLFQLDAADYEITHAVYFGDVHVVALCPGGVLIAGTHSDAGKRAGVFAFATRTPAGEAALVPLWNFTTPDDVWSLACPRPSPSNDGSKSPFPLVAGGWCWGLHLYSADGHGAAAVTSWSDGKPLLARDALLDTTACWSLCGQHVRASRIPRQCYDDYQRVAEVHVHKRTCHGPFPPSHNQARPTVHWRSHLWARSGSRFSSLAQLCFAQGLRPGGSASGWSRCGRDHCVR